MNTKDAIRYALELADGAVMGSLKGIEDAPTTFPTENGGCHPLWVVGHLTFVEGMTNEMIGGGKNTVMDLAPLFAQETTPSDDPSQYPSLETLRARYTELRKKNLALLDGMTEADLDTPTRMQPPGLEAHFATYGKALLTTAMHQTMHRAHITDAIRSAGRAVQTPVAVAA